MAPMQPRDGQGVVLTDLCPSVSCIAQQRGFLCMLYYVAKCCCANVLFPGAHKGRSGRIKHTATSSVRANVAVYSRLRNLTKAIVRRRKWRLQRPQLPLITI